MKFFFLGCCLTIVYAQTSVAQFADTFSDNDFTANPAWAGDVVNFTINTTQQLQLKASSAGISCLSTELASPVRDREWQFFIKQRFSPSGSNYARVYLASDTRGLRDAASGFYLQFGEAGSQDAIELFKQTGTTSVSICRGTSGLIASAFQVRVKVTRSVDGHWTIYTDFTGGDNFVLETSGTEGTAVPAGYFGIVCAYTSSNAANFFFDDFYVDAHESTDPSTADPASFKDVILTEIFADPSPHVGLPNAEYLELFNRSERSIDLSNWKIADGKSEGAIPSNTLASKEYLILTSTKNLTAFSAYNNALGISNFPTLNNSGDTLVLKNSAGNVIDLVTYSDSWYNDDDKQEGGWSLELIDPENICGERENWTASEDDNGGTPGKQNSVIANKPDVTGPKLISAFVQSSTQIKLQFSEKLAKIVPSIESFVITPASEISSISFVDNSLTSLAVSLTDALRPKTLYTISGRNIGDCAGNDIQNEFSTATFSITEKADSLDVVINEVLFNPRPTGVDFVELYNKSSKFINLRDWSIGSMENDSVTSIRKLFDEDHILTPSTYIALTTDCNIVSSEYPLAHAEMIFKVISLPALNDDEGSVVLLDQNAKVIDYFTYAKGMHSRFIKDEEGVSLERISFDQPTNSSQNWTSASAGAGFATPGYLNSCARFDATVAEESVKVDPEIFVPVTGQPDFTQIWYNFDRPSYIANVKIFDVQGHAIKELANNEVIGLSGSFRWDGDRENGSKARVGYYVVRFEVFDESGSIKTFHKRIVVASTF